MPRPQILQTTMVAIAIIATIQLVEQFAMAELARIRPMQMTMGTRNYGREEAHNARGAECAEERRKHQVKQAGACDAQACVGQKFGLAVGGDGSVARDERERRAQKRWHLALGQNMEEQRAQTGEQQRVAYRKAREYRHQNGGARTSRTCVGCPAQTCAACQGWSRRKRRVGFRAPKWRGRYRSWFAFLGDFKSSYDKASRGCSFIEIRFSRANSAWGYSQPFHTSG